MQDQLTRLTEALNHARDMMLAAEPHGDECAIRRYMRIAQLRARVYDRQQRKVMAQKKHHGN